MDKEKRWAATRLTQSRYNRHASSYDQRMSLMERLGMGRWRRLLWRLVRGPRVLELGTGTGANFAYYPEGVEVVAVDLSPQMLARAQARKEGQGTRVEMSLMDAEFLALQAASFDDVVTSCVFCSVPDPVAGLVEVRQVLRPGGRLLMLEHVRSQPPLGWLMDLANPLAARFSGANINRDTLGNLRHAGLEVVRVDNLFLDIVKLIQARAPEEKPN